LNVRAYVAEFAKSPSNFARLKGADQTIRALIQAACSSIDWPPALIPLDGKAHRRVSGRRRRQGYFSCLTGRAGHFPP
jgi:hypothetical protein